MIVKGFSFAQLVHVVSYYFGQSTRSDALLLKFMHKVGPTDFGVNRQYSISADWRSRAYPTAMSPGPECAG